MQDENSMIHIGCAQTDRPELEQHLKVVETEDMSNKDSPVTSEDQLELCQPMRDSIENSVIQSEVSQDNKQNPVTTKSPTVQFTDSLRKGTKLLKDQPETNSVVPSNRDSFKDQNVFLKQKPISSHNVAPPTSSAQVRSAAQVKSLKHPNPKSSNFNASNQPRESRHSIKGENKSKGKDKKKTKQEYPKSPAIQLPDTSRMRGAKSTENPQTNVQSAQVNRRTGASAQRMSGERKLTRLQDKKQLPLITTTQTKSPERSIDHAEVLTRAIQPTDTSNKKGSTIMEYQPGKLRTVPVNPDSIKAKITKPSKERISRPTGHSKTEYSHIDHAKDLSTVPLTEAQTNGKTLRNAHVQGSSALASLCKAVFP